MAKNNNNNNYFTQNIQKFGKDFLLYKNAKELEQESNKIFRELARGRVDLEKHGHYFLNQQFLESCIVNAYNKYTYHNISFTGINYFVINQPGAGQDMNIITVLEQHRRSAEAYCIILQTLNTIKSTYDYSYLYGLYDKLKNYRNYL